MIDKSQCFHRLSLFLQLRLAKSSVAKCNLGVEQSILQGMVFNLGKVISGAPSYTWINTRQRLVNKDCNLWKGDIKLGLGDASVYGSLPTTLLHTRMSPVLSVFCLIYANSVGDLF